MGLFDKRDKKRKDDFDSPVEQIDLSSVSTAKAAEPAPAPAPAKAAEPAPAVAARSAEPAPSRPQAQPEASLAKGGTKVTPETDDYGIEKAIELMRTLPQENVELVVQVVKFSLESVGIKLPVIIEDAIRRQKDIQGRIGVLRGEIAELEQEIKTRRDEIDRLEADHKETSMVRDRLELAENLGKPKPAVAASAPAAATPSSPALPGMTEARGEIPRVTRQTNPPPGGSSPSSPSLSPGAPLKK
jgi:hypothetical protein